MSDEEENKIITLEKKEPPEKWEINKQLELFGNFLTNDNKSVSNTIEFWEGIPKYFINSKQQEKLRTEAGHADPQKREYIKDGITYIAKIQPALIEQPDGTYKAFFPSVTEELIEETLKKIMSDQRYITQDANQAETWVKFSLHMIQKELKEHGKARSLDEIKHAIDVMSRSVIILFKGKKEIWTGAILQDLVTVDREEYKGNPTSLHVARLPLFISKAINHLEYRQFNYKRLMNSKNQLTRYIYKRLINKYTHANYLNDYHFLYSKIKKESGLLEAKEERENRRKLKNALDELIKIGVIYSYDAENKNEGKKIIDIKYTVKPSQEFISEQKAANKRQNNIIDIAQDKNNLPVDN